MKELEIREEKWKRIDEQLNELLKSNSEIIKLNIGGKKFSTRKDTILSSPGSLLYKIITSEKVDLNEELFFDRPHKYFSYILDYLRHRKMNYKRFKKEELKELKEEVDYYEIIELKDYLNELTKEIEFVSFESSGAYTYSGTLAGTNRVEDLKDKTLTKGICSASPGWILIELNGEWEFDEIECAGFNGNSTVWYVGNGASATIQTSKDKNNWTTVGTLPANFGATIQCTKLTKSTGRYIKFKNNAYLGLGYLNIKKKI